MENEVEGRSIADGERVSWEAISFMLCVVHLAYAVWLSSYGVIPTFLGFGRAYA